MSPYDENFWDAVERIRDRNPRYRREAYGFLLAALSRTVLALPDARRNDTERRHLSGGELVEGVIALARAEFGTLAPTVFEEWGVRSGSDVGELVFELVGEGQLFTRPEDRREDFDGGPDLLQSLRAPETPGTRPARREPDAGGIA